MSPDGYTGTPWANMSGNPHDGGYWKPPLAKHLRYEHGMKIADIAKIVGEPFNVVRSWLREEK